MFSILVVLLIIVAVFMTGVILLQKSEGSGMSGSSAAAMFGGALTGAAAGNFLTKLTTWLAVIFFVLCAALAFISGKTNVANPQSEIQAELGPHEEPAPEPSEPIEIPDLNSLEKAPLGQSPVNAEPLPVAPSEPAAAK
jgi:preprotein translocase subunit SecG